MKHIVLLSDGTGNSSAKLFKTNVWRLYQSLDMNPDLDMKPDGDPNSGGVRQVACYNDGVGTSAFKPLALLGGAFGWGLKRNVLHLYDFLCQQWEPGDQIYIFGFSRGAFTGRVLAGLIARQGIVVGQDDRTRAYAIRDVYRQYRFDSRNVVDVPLIVKIVRPIRGAFIAMRRRLLHQANFAKPGVTTNAAIHFLGVWDTVAAYGTPLAELTRGIDKKLFPLSMPDRTLRPEVLRARHALALDDERDTFHPLIWDEMNETNPDRLKQVWFAGMHADVGGGYPDDSLSSHPLVWMMEEAKQAGLRFLPHALERFAPPPSRSAPLHDSRKGLSGYYRYQPRRLSAYLLPDDPETAIMRDPSPLATAHMKSILIHHSVIERIQASTARYAPVVLPEQFEVVDSNGQILPSPETQSARNVRMAGQARVFDIVWCKRVAYFGMVIVSLLPVTLPFWGAQPESGACQAFYCAFAPLIRAIGAFLPGILQYWTDALANNLPITLAFAVSLTALLLLSGYLQDQIQDIMWQLWAPLRGGPAGVSRKPSLVNRIRTSEAYLATVRAIKWQVLPQVLGTVAAVLVTLGSVGLLAVPMVQQTIAASEARSQICNLGPPAHDDALFHTNVPCWRYKDPVQAGTQYRVELTVKEPWLDGTTPASPLGIDTGAYDKFRGYRSLPFRRTLSGRWYQPFVTIQPDPAAGHASQTRPVVQPLEFVAEGDRFVARLVPAASGHLDLWVNQSVLGIHGMTGADYADNHGSAEVCIAEQTKPCLGVEMGTTIVRSGY